MYDTQEVNDFIAQWPESPDRCRDAFLVLHRFLLNLDGVNIEFHPRPGITYSLRGVNPKRSDYPLMVLVDVIEDQPRWLSVCFYERLVSDPDSRGERVPGGLLGEDGLCFDVDSFDDSLLDYLQQRIEEVWKGAGD